MHSSKKGSQQNRHTLYILSEKRNAKLNFFIVSIYRCALSLLLPWTEKLSATTGTQANTYPMRVNYGKISFCLENSRHLLHKLELSFCSCCFLSIGFPPNYSCSGILSSKCSSCHFFFGSPTSTELFRMFFILCLPPLFLFVDKQVDAHKSDWKRKLKLLESVGLHRMRGGRRAWLSKMKE